MASPLCISFNSFAPLGGVSAANGSKRYSASAMRSSASTRTAPAFDRRAQLQQSCPATGGAADDDIGRIVSAHAPPAHFAKRLAGGKFVGGHQPAALAGGAGVEFLLA